MKLEKIVQDSVRITIYKLAKFSEYLQAKLMPQYNMPTGTPMDLDTLSSTVTNHVISKKYQYGLNY